MAEFSYSFCMTLLHSIWQAALLFSLFIIIDKSTKQKSPLINKNWLFLILTLQLGISAITFLLYFFSISNNFTINNINRIVTDFLPAQNLHSISTWLFSIYILIISYKFFKIIYNWHQFKNTYRQDLQKPSVDLKLFTNLKANHFGIKRKVEIWLSNKITTPVTFGFLKPIILLPVALINNINLKQAETLIVHELAHIKSSDYLLNWYLLFIETIFFFNPFTAIICKRIRLEREKCCDINVIAFDYSPTLYAETLLQAERIKQLKPSFQLAAVNGKNELLKRIQFFTSDFNFKKQKRHHLLPSLLGICLLIIFSVGALLFGSHNNITSITVATTIKHINSFQSENIVETPTPVFKNNISPNIKKQDVSIAFIKEEKQNIALKKNNNRQPLITLPIEQEEIIADNTIEPDNNFVQTIAITENNAYAQIIISEEHSGTKSASIKSYQLIFENGEWRLVPQWIITAKEIAADSVANKKYNLTD